MKLSGGLTDGGIIIGITKPGYSQTGIFKQGITKPGYS